LLAARLFTGLFGGLQNATVNSIVADLVPPEKRATGMGIVQMGFSIASILGVPAGLWLASLPGGWHTPFWAIAGAGTIIWVVLWCNLPPLEDHVVAARNREWLPPWTWVQEMLRTPERRLAAALMMTLIFSQFFVIPFMPTFLAMNVHVPENKLGWIYILGGGATLLTSPFIGRMADKVGKARMFFVMAPLSALIIGIFSNLPGLKTDYWLLGLMPAAFFIISIHGRMIPALALSSMTAPAQERGGFMLILAAVQNLGGGLATLVAGFVVNQKTNGHLENYPLAGMIAISLTLAAVLLMRELNRAVIASKTDEHDPQTSAGEL
jgi:predicted MFS family arabinose efflux permease